MSRKSLFIVCSLFLLSSCFVLRASIAYAQVPTAFGIDLAVSSQNPVPGQTVTITARSYSTNINSAKLTWSVNGKIAQSGNGLTTFKTIAPALGKKTSITVTALTPDGLNITGTVTLTSGSVDMIVETNGYTPPSFKGKNPVVFQNTVKVIAMPHIMSSAGTEYDPKTLVYQWKKNDQVIDDQSGYGKQSVTIVGDIVPRPYDLTVTASPRTGSGQAKGIITIAPSSPSIAFYVDDPLYGPLFNTAVGDTLRIGSQKETSVLAVPYGFNGVSSSLSLSWLINNLEHTELAASQSVILRAPNGTSGSSNIELDIRNNDQILQGAKAGFTATFSNKASSDSTVTY